MQKSINGVKKNNDKGYEGDVIEGGNACAMAGTSGNFITLANNIACLFISITGGVNAVTSTISGISTGLSSVISPIVL
jgi:hypothetical protein